jgi:predicted Zn-dependent peptidase
LFADHPYHVTSPTQDSISASTPAGLRSVFAQRFRPDQAILIAVGDFENDKMLANIKSAFANWKSSATSPISAIPSPPAGVDHAVFVVPRPGSVQTTIELATFGPVMGDPDYESAQVANAIYGGTFGSRLVTNIREDKGYTYSPFAFLNPFQKTGEVISHADVRNAVTAASLNEIQYELNRLATTTPTDEELTTAKRFLVGREALRLQDRGSVARRLATLWISGLQPDQIGIYGHKVSATTKDDVNAAARKYFPAYRCAVIVVGEEKVVREALEPFGLPIRSIP